jgi:serine/threonine protein kinase
VPTPELKVGQVIVSSVSGRRYKVRALLGRGGFGRAYRAVRVNRAGRSMGEVCVKTTRDQASWHREAYFGDLLRGNRRVIQIHDAFPLVRRPAGRTVVLFCLAAELAEQGAVRECLERASRPWSPARASREVMALLKVLGELHRSQVTHRDITPDNIFVCGRGTLKLGDFGIATQQLGRRVPVLDAFNSDFVSRRVLHGVSPRWGSVDDVFQMGQLLAMLLLGQADGLVTARTLRRIECSAALRAVITRAIGPRGRRYADAGKMFMALRRARGRKTA